MEYLNEISLYVILDIPLLEKLGKNPEYIMRETYFSGARMFQLRHKEADEGEIYRIAKRLLPIAKELGALFIINDSLSVALASNSDGVHLGETDLPLAVARKLVEKFHSGQDFIIGASVSSLEIALRAQKQGATYLGYGSIFETRTKDNPIPGSIEELKSIIDSVDIPTFAIGGINEQNVNQIVNAGCRKVCVASGIIARKNPGKSAQEIYDILNKS
ncbi:thiamine phosphate synthase [bacterium]|nr:MAG: thiamine phosphate synthase [bacterium]